MFIRPMPARTTATAVPVPGLEYYDLPGKVPAVPPVAGEAPADRPARIAEALDRMFAYYGDPIWNRSNP